MEQAATFFKVNNAVGLEIYYFLHPADLFHLSLTSIHIFDEIRNDILQIALRQLPFILKDDDIDQVEYQVKVSKDRSYPSREHLLHHVLQKIEVAELKFAGQTHEESLINAKEVLNTEKKPGVYGATLMSETSWRFPDPEYTHVGYNYQQENKDSATVRCKDILERMSSTKDISIFKCWMGYLFAQKSLVIGSWFWTCRHRHLDFHGVEGKGIVFSIPETKECLEVQCAIMTRSRAGDEDDESAAIIPQFAVATRVDDTRLNSLTASASLHADVLIEEGDVYAVPNPFIVSPQEQEAAGIIIGEGDVYVVPADEEELLITGEAVRIVGQRQKAAKKV
jgi:hypothetical protein